jgi:hypothetical protein
MAKPITFNTGEKFFQAAINKVDRDKVYGYIEESISDANGEICLSGNLLDDGSTIILSGATALKTIDFNNNEVDKKSLKAVYMDGKDATLIPSSYDGEVKLELASADDLYNLEVTAVYQLDFENLSVAKKDVLTYFEGEKYYRFVFNYRADYEGADAIMLATENDVFVLTGRMLSFEYLENKNKPVVIEEEVTTGNEEDNIDFGML